MKILIIGGGLFVGRVLALTANREHDVTVLNRGHYPLLQERILEIKADRHDPEALKQLSGEAFDVVIDTCAYVPGDIQMFFDHSGASFQQYVMISSLDVTRRQVGHIKDETEGYETRPIPGKVGAYIHGKVALEQELRACAKEHSVQATIVRCAFIYGPFNYAQREPWFVRQMLAGKPVYEPVDADGQFNLLYVKDLASQVLALCGNPKAYGEIFNLCNEEIVTYQRFFALLRKLDIPQADIRPVMIHEVLEGRHTVENCTGDEVPYEINGEEMHFPFPATAEETELYSNKKITDLTGIPFTDFDTAMMHTLELFRSIYGGQ